MLNLFFSQNGALNAIFMYTRRPRPTVLSSYVIDVKAFKYVIQQRHITKAYSVEMASAHTVSPNFLSSLLYLNNLITVHLKILSFMTLLLNVKYILLSVMTLLQVSKYILPICRYSRMCE